VTNGKTHGGVDGGYNYKAEGEVQAYGDSGGASRFFYVAKASSSERWFYCNDCNDAFPPSEKENHWHGHVNEKGEKTWDHLESHPTQKPLSLMRHLTLMVCRPGGTVLDPFAGSGTTGLACQMEGFDYILIEKDPHFAQIIRRRLNLEE
jgi:site-specific DNA-methyltransferase (adenine-specific)